jgi:hypothetical protein
MTYVSPFDDRRAPAIAAAPRPATLAGARVVLLDISKAQGDRFLDRVEERLHALGATTTRLVKPGFSRAAPGELLERVAIHGDLAVEGLAD